MNKKKNLNTHNQKLFTGTIVWKIKLKLGTIKKEIFNSFGKVFSRYTDGLTFESIHHLA